MPVGIVHRLELVDVDDHATHRTPGARRRCPLLLHAIDRIAPVGKSRKRIGQRDLLQATVGHRQFGCKMADLFLVLLDRLLQADHPLTCTQPRGEHPGTQRFVDEVVGAVLERLDEALVVVLRGQHQHIDAATDSGLAQAAREFEPIHLGQYPVDDHHLGLDLEGQFEALAPVDRLEHLMPRTLQHAPQQ